MPADEVNQARKIITKTEANPQLNPTWPSNQFAEASLNTILKIAQANKHASCKS